MFLKFFGLRRRNTIIVFWFARFCNTCVIFIFGMHNSRISPMCDDSVAIGRFGRLAALQSKKQKIKESTAVTSPEFGGDLVTVSRGSSGLKPLPSQRCAPKFRVPSCTSISFRSKILRQFLRFLSSCWSPSHRHQIVPLCNQQGCKAVELRK